MTKRKALGKGLSSLIPEAPPAAASTGIQQIDVGLIQPGSQQPRTRFEESALAELAESVRAHGVIQPVVVSRDGGGFRLIVGERRWRAAVQAGLGAIPAVVREVGEKERLEMALVENLQRQDLNPVEEARACRLLMTENDMTQEEVARRLGKSRPYVANSLRLLSLAPGVQGLVTAGKLTAGHARALAGVNGGSRQLELARTVVSRSLSVRQLEELIGRERETAGDEKVARPSPGARDPNVRAAEERLKRSLGTTVRIRGRGQKGRIEVDYVSAAELDRLFDLLEAAGKRAPAPPATHRSLPGRPAASPETSG